MTGFARVTGSLSTTDFDIEAKSVNSRYLEVGVKGPVRFSALEREVKPIFQKLHSRGRIDVSISRKVLATKPSIPVSDAKLEPMISAYINTCKRYGAGTAGLSQFIATLFLREQNDILEIEELSDQEMQLMRALIEQVSEMLAESRTIEGAALLADILPRVQKLRALGASVQQHVSGAPERVKARLLERLSHLAPEVLGDRERLALEVALLADRIDVTEELSRFEIHISQFITCIQRDGSQGVGRKLDFLSQEIGRELNTIGSKAQDAIAQGLVVEAKAELEKIREQVQNIE